MRGVSDEDPEGGGALSACTATLTAFCLLAQLVHVAPAAAEPLAPAPAPRELLDRRTATTRTLDNGDGTYTFESHVEPINYRDSGTGAWEPVGNELVPAPLERGAGLVNRANRFSVFLPDDPASGRVSVEEEGAVVTMRPVGRFAERGVRPARLAEAVVKRPGRTARLYAGAFDSADLLYEVLPTGLKETIVVSRPEGGNIFSFDLALEGLDPSASPDGSIALVSRRSGKTVFTVAAPYMFDSSNDAAGESAYSEAVSYKLSRTVAGWRLDVVADASWLSDPTRVYPVMIDPTTYSEGALLASEDAYVTSAFPSSNYGSATELKTGRVNSSGTGINRSYIKPDLSPLLGQNLTVLDAKLSAYCFWKYYHTTSCSISVKGASAAWSSSSITWNNQPATTALTSASVSEGAWAQWTVTSLVADYVSGVKQPHGFCLTAASETTDLTYWCKFYSRESGAGPYLTVTFTSVPKLTIVAPTLEIPVGTDAGPRAVWTYEDAFGKAQSKAQVQLARASGGVFSTLSDTGEVATTDSSMPIKAPAGGWAGGRWWVRARVWGTAENGSVSASAWSDWQPFERKALTTGSDGAGIAPVHPTEPVGGGLAIDLTTGRLVGARTDLAVTGLGGALGATLTYDSSRTADVGLGPGWRVAAPTYAPLASLADNTGFEDASADEPAGWVVSNTSYVSVFTPAGFTPKGGQRYLSIGQPSGAGSYISATVKTAGGSVPADLVVPGDRVSAGAYVMTSGFATDPSQPTRGALLRVYFYDRLGNAMPAATVTSAQHLVANSAAASDWHRVGLECTVPEGAYLAILSLEALHVKGYALFDDVTFTTHGFSFTDSDGTGRTFTPAGRGAYTRDPLEPGLRFRRANALQGASVFGKSSTGTEAAIPVPESIDGVTTNNGPLTNFDSVECTASGEAYLRWELAKPELLSEVDLYLWDWDIGPRTYRYRVEVRDRDAGTGAWVPVTGSEQTGRSWVRCSFPPRRVTDIRVVGMGNTANEGLHICEIEAPVLRLSDGVVVFDEAGRLVASADPSGNPVHLAYDGSGRLVSVSDDTGRAAGATPREVRLHRDASGFLGALDVTNHASDGTTSTETGIVRYSRTGGTLSVLRSAEATGVPVLRYGYDASDRIVSVTDADGVAAAVSYGASGRVISIERTGDPHPAVTTLTYAGSSDPTPTVTIATAAAGLAAPARSVAFAASLGGQAVSVTTIDPEGDDPAVTFSYDEYGQVFETTDALGRKTRTVTDGRGHAVKAEAVDAAGAVARTTRAVYGADHLVRAIDAKGNETGLAYDAAWRAISAVTVTGEVAAEGAAVSNAGYDEWGNTEITSFADSTAYNLLKNGAFETNPITSGNGWDGSRSPGGSTYEWITNPGQDYLGARSLKLVGFSTGEPWFTSDKVAVRGSTAYSLSLWLDGPADVRVNFYAGTVFLSGTQALVARSSFGGTPGLDRVSGTFTTPPTATFAAVEMRGEKHRTTLVDNVRLELANRSSGDSLVENQSMETVASGLPVPWTRRDAGLSTAIHDVSSVERVSGAYSAHIGHSSSSATGYFYSAAIPVRPGERYTAAASIKTKASAGGAHAMVYFFDSGGAYVTGSVVELTDAFVKGTAEWRRYAKDLTVPAGAATAKVALQHQGGGGDAWFDAVSFTPASGTGTAVYDAATHTYATQTTGPTGVAATGSWDSRGRLVSSGVTPAGGQGAFAASEREYDALDRVTRVETAPDSGLGIEARYAYSDAGRLESVTDPLGRSATISFDAAGRPIGVTSPTDIRTRTVYDALGRMSATLAPARGAEPTVTAHSVAYDGLSRVRSSTHHDAAGAPYATLTPSYDLASRVVSRVLTGETTASASYTYDTLDRATGLSTAGPAGVVQFTTAYDPADLPTSVVCTAFGSPFTLAHTYAKSNEPVKTAGLGMTWAFGMAPSGLSAARSSAGSSPVSSLTRSFDVFGRTETVTSGRQQTLEGGVFATSAVSTRLSYDTLSRTATSTVTGDGAVGTYTDAYSYDRADRLTSWSRTGTGATSASYTWDAAGNLTAKTEGGVTTAFTSDAENRLTRAQTGSAVTTYTNDLWGRRTQMTSLSGATTYTWDPLGHLTSASSATATATYAYGIFGMREQKTVTTASGTKETRSVWDGQRLSAERDSDGTLYRYLHAPDGTPLTLQLTPAGGAPVTYSYHTDAQGSVVALTRDGTGAIAATYAYDAFGRLLSAGGSEPALAERNPLRYRGYYLDAETGLYYLPARYYDPATARFLSPDPAPPQAGDPLSLNAYAYCQGDPVNKWDPDGRRLVAYGGASPVHTEAVKAARSGKLPKARQVQQAYRRALATARAAGMRFDAGREYAAAFVEESEALNVAAGVLAGISAGAATVSAGAALTALATSPAALTGVGAVAPGTALYVAVGAGVVSFATGVGYSVLTKYRVDRGDIPESDIRANAVFDRVSLGSSAAGAGLRVTASTPLTGMVGLGLSWAAIGYELLTY